VLRELVGASARSGVARRRVRRAREAGFITTSGWRGF